MNNEPVAWMLLRDEVCVELTEWFGDMRGWEEFLGDNEKIVELYTRPSEHDLGIADAIGFERGYKAATVKELTDEKEALKSLYDAVIRYENLSPFPDKYAIESCEYQLHDAKERARTILRKAQEK